MRILTASMVIAGLLATPVQAATTLNVWHVFNLQNDMIYDGIAKFEKAHPDIHVQARLVPLAQMGQELIRALATGSVPDVATIDNPVMPSFSAQGQLEEIGPDLEKFGITGDKFYRGPWASVMWDGKVYGAPRASNTVSLYYNVDMFKKAGLDPDSPPKTWAELRADAEKLTDKSAKVYGLAFSAVQSDEGVYQLLPFLQQAGGDISHLDSPEAETALQFLADMVKDGYASPDVVNMRQYEAMNTLINGNSAMAISGPWELPRIDKEAKFAWRVAELPVKEEGGTNATALGGFDWAVPKGAENRDAAVEFIAFMESPEVLQHAWDTGRLPSRNDITIENPKWPDAYRVFKTELAYSRPRGPHPQWPDISLAIQNAIQQALTGQATPKEALATAAAKIAPILAKTPLPQQ